MKSIYIERSEREQLALRQSRLGFKPDKLIDNFACLIRKAGVTHISVVKSFWKDEC